MKRIVIEKVFVYMLGFLFCLILSLNQGTSSSNAEQEFLNDISSTMKTYNYVKTECLTCDLEYVKNDDNIKFEYNVNVKDVKTKRISAEFNLNYVDDLNIIYSLLNKLYNDNILIYDSEIQKMIKDYVATGEEQMFQNLNKNRQLTLRINKTTSVGKDYQLYYSIINIER